MVIIVLMTYFDVATNMVIIGVYSKRPKNADQIQKRFEKRSDSLKVMTKTKILSKYRPFPLYFRHVFQLAWAMAV